MTCVVVKQVQSKQLSSFSFQQVELHAFMYFTLSLYLIYEFISSQVWQIKKALWSPNAEILDWTLP